MISHNSTNRQMLLLCFTLLFSTLLEAQRLRYTIPGLDTLEQTFIVGGGSSTVLQSGSAEVIFNSSLVSHWIAFHEVNKNSPILERFRRTQFTSDLTAFYGISQSGQLDIGINFKYVRGRLDNEASSSMLRVFQPSKPENIVDGYYDPSAVFDNSFGGLASIGLRARFKPFPNRPEIVLNGGYSIITVKDQVVQQQLAADRDAADIGATYYKKITSNIYYFLSGTVQAYLPSNVRDELLFSSSLGFFIIHRTSDNRWTLYPGLVYGLSFKPSKFDENPLIKTNDQLLALAGLQYAPTNKVNFILTGGLPLFISNSHPQLDIVRASYSIIGVGLRAGF